MKRYIVTLTSTRQGGEPYSDSFEEDEAGLERGMMNALAVLSSDPPPPLWGDEYVNGDTLTIHVEVV